MTKGRKLETNFNREEVSCAIEQIHPNKAPGLDRIAPVFFQNYWDVIETNITEAVLKALQSSTFPPLLNTPISFSFLKRKGWRKLFDFRPISLCNFLYKIIAKVLANRLKTIISHIISPTQSTFVPGHLITDNVLVAYELMHYFNQKKNGKKDFMSLKLDISKAYDRVEWYFL